MNNNPWQVIEQLSAALYADSAEHVGWQWDGRFYGALAQFEIDKEEQMSSVLERHLGAPYTDENITAADEVVQIIGDVMGGLRPGQRLYVSAPDRSPLLYAAYWPWGNNTTISVRLIPSGQGLSGDEMKRLVELFCQQMGLSPT